MSWFRRSGLACGFAIVTFLSAFLVFQVQPIVSKSILPWFGGCPAVWTTCMLFFQVVLFAGYSYAHALTTCCSIKRQGCIHLGLIALSLLVVPIVPEDAWKPMGNENPTLRILLILTMCVGAPYFLLSSTGPLLQAWFSRTNAGQSPYRLYALSNIGSLLALLSYPFVIEPAWDILMQGAVWSIAFCAFAVLCSLIVLSLRSELPEVEQAASGNNAVTPEHVPLRAQVAWLLLPAFASILLLATTNHVCQDVAVVPFLWIAPLSLYLLTFIICFDREAWYSRLWLGVTAIVAILSLHLALHFYRTLPLIPEVGLCLLTMFALCMICHGELVKAKPSTHHLTRFYLCTSAGGALGGVVVAVICPLVFTTHYEMKVSLLAGTLLACVVVVREFPSAWFARPQRKVLAALTCLAMLLFVARVHREQGSSQPLAASRNFYGTLCVTKTETDSTMGTALIHGRIIHGFQFDDPSLKAQPTTYYSPDSGVGRVLRHMRVGQPQKVGAVGLGCGTIAAFGRPGDLFRFYEINPAVVTVAKENFSFLKESQAKIEIQLGDARLSLEREEPQQFDALILDAFSGDSVPAHLLTREAFAVYRRHIKPDGVIVVHVSNRHLRLEPVVIRQAEHLKMPCVHIVSPASRERAILVSKWMLVTNNTALLSDPQIASVAQTFRRRPGAAEFPLWTDRYNNLFQILSSF